MEVKSTREKLNEKIRWLRLLPIQVENKEKIAARNSTNNELKLLSTIEKQDISTISELFSTNTFHQSASNNKNITEQVFQNLENILEGKLSLKDFKSNITQLKEQDRKEIKSSHGWTIGIATLALIIGVPSLVLYFFYPDYWIFEALGGFISVLCAGLSIYIGYITYKHKENVMSIWWGGVSGNGIQTIVNQLTPEDVKLLQKINSPEWQTKFDEANEKTKQTANEINNSQQFGSPLDTTPSPNPATTKTPTLKQTQDAYVKK